MFAPISFSKCANERSHDRQATDPLLASDHEKLGWRIARDWCSEASSGLSSLLLGSAGIFLGQPRARRGGDATAKEEDRGLYFPGLGEQIGRASCRERV